MDLDLKVPVIIDNGSGMIKAGLCGQQTPSCCFPSIVGRQKHRRTMVKTGTKEAVIIGDALQYKRGGLSLSYPIEHGIIKDWKGMESIWEYTFGHLTVNPLEHPVLLTEAALNPKQNREKMAQTMFENFSIPALYIEVQAVLCLYSTGDITGLVLDCGDGVCNTVPVYEGYALTHAINRMDLAGRDITNELGRRLHERGIQINTSAERDIIRDMKEKLAYVAQDYQQEVALQKGMLVEYELPDGHKIRLSDERFSCTEILFNPFDLIGLEVYGVQDMVYNSVQKCGIDLRKSLFRNIILSGGTTMLPGFVPRLEKEILEKSVNDGNHLDELACVANTNRKYSVWLGGSQLASLSTFQNVCFSKSEYEEEGSSMIHRRRKLHCSKDISRDTP